MLEPLASHHDLVQATEIFTPQNNKISSPVPREKFQFIGLNNLCDSFFQGKPMSSSPSSMDVDMEHSAKYQASASQEH